MPVKPARTLLGARHRWTTGVANADERRNESASRRAGREGDLNMSTAIYMRGACEKRAYRLAVVPLVNTALALGATHSGGHTTLGGGGDGVLLLLAVSMRVACEAVLHTYDGADAPLAPVVGQGSGGSRGRDQGDGGDGDGGGSTGSARRHCSVSMRLASDSARLTVVDVDVDVGAAHHMSAKFTAQQNGK